ncbi:MAG: hypothetical protein RQ826_18025 [Xanthomonadales bacterium]|nr:hypothetical protein [Xanthomonadales bacterium]
MRSLLPHLKLSTLFLCITAFFAVSTAQAQTSVLEHAARMHSGPDEYYFFEDDRKQVIDYKTERMVRICTGQSRHLVPMKVTYDNKTATLGSDECIRVEAKKVLLEPAERLKPNYVIEAEVETL